MKGNSPNNPVVVGVLICVLFGAIVVTIKGLRGEGGPVATVRLVTPAALKQADESVAEAPLARSNRNPFDHPALRKVAAAQAAPLTPIPDPVAAVAQPGGQKLPVASAGGKLPDLHIAELSHTVSPQALAAHPLFGSAASRQASDPRAPEHLSPEARLDAKTAPPTLRMTAVMSGNASASAVIEGLESGPVTVRAGERVGEWRVAAINAREAVLIRRGGIVTVPLAVSEADPSKGERTAQ